MQQFQHIGEFLSTHRVENEKKLKFQLKKNDEVYKECILSILIFEYIDNIIKISLKQMNVIENEYKALIKKII